MTRQRHERKCQKVVLKSAPTQLSPSGTASTVQQANYFREKYYKSNKNLIKSLKMNVKLLKEFRKICKLASKKNLSILEKALKSAENDENYYSHKRQQISSNKEQILTSTTSLPAATTSAYIYGEDDDEDENEDESEEEEEEEYDHTDTVLSLVDPLRNFDNNSASLMVSIKKEAEEGKRIDGSNSMSTTNRVPIITATRAPNSINNNVLTDRNSPIILSSKAMAVAKKSTGGKAEAMIKAPRAMSDCSKEEMLKSIQFITNTKKTRALELYGIIREAVLLACHSMSIKLWKEQEENGTLLLKTWSELELEDYRTEIFENVISICVKKEPILGFLRRCELYWPIKYFARRRWNSTVQRINTQKQNSINKSKHQKKKGKTTKGSSTKNSNKKR